MPESGAGFKKSGRPSGEAHLVRINTYNDLVAEGLAALGIRETVWEVADFFDRIRICIGGLEFSAVYALLYWFTSSLGRSAP